MFLNKCHYTLQHRVNGFFVACHTSTFRLNGFSLFSNFYQCQIFFKRLMLLSFDAPYI